MSELIPIYRAPQASGDVVFVHGLGGDPIKTWGFDRPSSWKQWLQKNRPDLNVWSVRYDVHPSEWAGTSMPLSDRALNVLALLDNNELGKNPIVFICHSMGGLLVKEMLRHAHTVTSRYRPVIQNTRAVIFFATPHTGSDLAYYVGYLGFFLRNSVSIAELHAHHPRLRDLNLWFRNNFDDLSLVTCIFFESEKTHGVRVVDETSADPGIPHCSPIRIDADHISISKPTNYRAIVVGQTLKTIDVAIPNKSYKFSPNYEFPGEPQEPSLERPATVAGSLRALVSSASWKWAVVGAYVPMSFLFSLVAQNQSTATWYFMTEFFGCFGLGLVLGMVRPPKVAVSVVIAASGLVPLTYGSFWYLAHNQNPFFIIPISIVLGFTGIVGGIVGYWLSRAIFRNKKPA
jgi:pimeloyl-ACP methyl ester carboxylesterase